MRAFVLVALLFAVAGCGDDDDGSGGHADMAVAGSDGGGPANLAMAPADMVCVLQEFGGFVGTNTVFRSLACPCGCNIDEFENAVLNGMWGNSVTSGAQFVPLPKVGLGMALDTSGALEQAGLVSVTTIAQFYLAGDFDVLVDYDFGDSPPPGEAHLVLGVRVINGVSSVSTFEVARVHPAVGVDDYQTHLGGIDQHVPTTATHGTLRLVRSGLMLTAYGDGQQVSTRVTADNPRLALTLTATLQGCDSVDGGAASCSFQPRWHLLRMTSGTLVNKP